MYVETCVGTWSSSCIVAAAALNGLSVSAQPGCVWNWKQWASNETRSMFLSSKPSGGRRVEAFVCVFVCVCVYKKEVGKVARMCVFVEQDEVGV